MKLHPTRIKLVLAILAILAALAGMTTGVAAQSLPNPYTNNQPAGAATCVGRNDDPPVVKFSPDGQLLDSWGEGVFAAPHGFHIDPEGNLWGTDYNGSETVLGMPAGGRGHQVFKFSPTGEILMTLGKAGVAGNGPDTFDRPSDVAVNASGDIFVTDGHGPNNRVVKFDRNGQFL